TRFKAAHGLDKLGRGDAPKRGLDGSRKSKPAPATIFAPAFMPGASPSPATPHAIDVAFARDYTAAEVFLSVDEPDEAIAFIKQSMKDAPDEETRCYSAVVLAQVLLLLDRKGDYLEFLTQSLMP